MHSIFLTRVEDPHHFNLMRIRIHLYLNADPTRTFHLTFHSNADPDPAAQNIADPDPQPCFKLYPILPNKNVWKNYVKY
jgi:hypothetical protein